VALQLDQRFRIVQRVEGRLGPEGELRGASAVRFAADGAVTTAGSITPARRPGAARRADRPRAEAQSFAGLRRTLAGLEETGQTRPPEELVLHTKLAFPLLNLGGRAPGLASRAPPRSTGWIGRAPGWPRAALPALGAPRRGLDRGRVGWLSPAAAVWAPTGAGVLLGGVLALRALRRC